MIFMRVDFPDPLIPKIPIFALRVNKGVKNGLLPSEDRESHIFEECSIIDFGCEIFHVKDELTSRPVSICLCVCCKVNHCCKKPFFLAYPREKGENWKIGVVK